MIKLHECSSHDHQQSNNAGLPQVGLQTNQHKFFITLGRTQSLRAHQDLKTAMRMRIRGYEPICGFRGSFKPLCCQQDMLIKSSEKLRRRRCLAMTVAAGSSTLLQNRHKCQFMNVAARSRTFLRRSTPKRSCKGTVSHDGPHLKALPVHNRGAAIIVLNLANPKLTVSAQ